MKEVSLAKRDAFAKVYMLDSEHFADAFNYYLFAGERKINGSDLCEVDTSEMGLILSEDGSEEVVQKVRDVLKSLIIKQDDTTTYVLLGH